MWRSVDCEPGGTLAVRPPRDMVSGRRPRRRRSVSRILSSRPGSGSSSHSSGPPVARGIERPTRGNGRAARAWPRGQTSLLHGLAPGGVYRASALSSGPGELLPHRFTVAPRPKARGCLLSVALSPDRSGPPLAATMPCGVRTFLPPREAASDCSTSSGGKRILIRTVPPARPVQGAACGRSSDENGAYWKFRLDSLP